MSTERWIKIDLAAQRLYLYDDNTEVFAWPASTAANGPGELNGSGCTPRGWHVIRARIGAGQAVNTVFIGRRPTGEVLTPELYAAAPERDWILTRILWLSGLERGKNRLGNVDTMRRYIYIHGTPDSEALTEPTSQGCVRMRNADIMQLFDHVAAGTRVLITENKQA
ncbi:MAG: L,D-transpeptidase [Thiohalomonadaceae bacterium]